MTQDSKKLKKKRKKKGLAILMPNTNRERKMDSHNPKVPKLTKHL